MAARKQNPLEKKQEALDLLDRGRAEISAEMHWLRAKMDPRRALSQTMERHSAMVVGGALALGLLVPVLLLRRRHQRAAPPVREAIPRHPTLQRKLAGQLVSLAASALLPRVVTPFLESWITRRLSPTRHSSRV